MAKDRREDAAVSGLIKVVREKFLPHSPGMTVQSLLTPEERDQVLEGKLKAFDREGHEIGLQGALSPGWEVILRQTERA